MPVPASSPQQILQYYWGYDTFREKQREIIDSVLNGRDTLGLLPTGGGKSITFQVPALMLEGLTLVVTPLISLMKDQVDNLRQRSIPASALHSGLTRAEHRLALDRARLGKLKILYLSPEKLQSKSFAQQLAQLNVSLIVVDEAHCISQWGYDFRPSYLKIASLRKVFPDAPVLALTASATKEVTADIMERLRFKSPNVFARSFTRPNISYIVRQTSDKQGMLLRVLQSTAGSAIVYCRSRRRTKEIADLLVQHQISAQFYHAGLDAHDKNTRQNQWKEGKTRVMVATNAFGMGIDKPDVRTVVHIDLPSSLEEYYQEAGRAGRDGLPSYAVIITDPPHDKAILTRRLSEAFPNIDTIRQVYEHACNFVEIAVGSGYGTLAEFNFALFCERFKFKPTIARSALNLLSRAEYIDYVDEIATQSRVMVIMDKRSLYELMLDPVTDTVFQYLLRTYTGLFAEFVHISEPSIALNLNISEQQVYESLLKLSRQHALSYVPRRSTPYIYFTTSRELPRHIVMPTAIYADQRQRMLTRIEAMKQFVYSTEQCRVATMLKYFGEQAPQDCGTCDVCRARKKLASQTQTIHRIRQNILSLAAQQPTSIDQIIARTAPSEANLIINITRQMAQEHLIRISDGYISIR